MLASDRFVGSIRTIVPRVKDASSHRFLQFVQAGSAQLAHPVEDNFPGVVVFYLLSALGVVPEDSWDSPRILSITGIYGSICSAPVVRVPNGSWRWGALVLRRRCGPSGAIGHGAAEDSPTDRGCGGGCCLCCCSFRGLGEDGLGRTYGCRLGLTVVLLGIGDFSPGMHPKWPQSSVTWLPSRQRD